MSCNTTCTRFPNTACIWFRRMNWAWQFKPHGGPFQHVLDDS